MPSSSVAQILLRLFALNWFLSGLVQAASVAAVIGREHFSLAHFTECIVLLVAGILVWAASPKLSRLLARRNDGEFSFKGVTEEQLYAGVILGLGLYFALSSFSAAFSWVHYFAVTRSSEHGFHQESQPSYYDLSETLMTLAAGLFLALTCTTWARKLARKNRAPTDDNSASSPEAGRDHDGDAPPSA